MPSNMTFTQASTLLNSVVKQMTGQAAATAITTPADLVSVAQTALLTGADEVYNAVSKVWARTIFAVRDYRAPLDDLQMTIDAYGAAVRKLSPVSGEMSDDQRFLWPVKYDVTGHSDNAYGNGESVDMYKISKQDVLQTNFYGAAVYQQRYTIFRDQLNAAFNDANEFARFNSMMMQERMNDRESYREGVARTLQANFIAALIDENDAARVVHLLTEYNEQTGLSLTAQSVFADTNFPAFVRWMYSRITTLAQMMAERSNKYQTVINNKAILRHTNAENLRVAVNSTFYNMITSMGLPVTYHDNMLKLPKFRPVTYWQSIDSPMEVNVTPVYTDTTGSVKTGSAVDNKAVVAIMHDTAALGYASINPWVGRTPLNIDGGYWNETYHDTYKTISDNTEKAIVLMLD